jgi:diguanylate cyclase (GGDEF)-like protein/PAS domain S-box-containing protein
MENNISSSRYTRFLRNWPVLSVFVLCLLLTVFSFFFDKQHHRKVIIEHASRDGAEYQRRLQEGANTYVHLNRDVAGLFAASGDVTFQEFDVYISSVNAFETHPGLGYIGYGPRVANSSAAEFEAKARKNFTSYKIHGPHPDADFTYPLLYRFPYDESARQFTGFDFSGIPQRWEAMQKARDLGRSIATAKHAQRKNPHQKNIIVIFTPIYQFGKPIETIAQRRAALTGFVHSSFVVDEVIEYVMGSKFKNLFDLEIYDGAVNRENILYDGDNQPHVLERDAYSIVHQENVDFAGRNWFLYFYPKPAYFEKYAHNRSWLILFSGVLFSVALAFLTWKWQRYRYARRLQFEHGQRFQAIFENHPSAVYSLDLQRRFINVNAKALEEFEISKDKLIGSSVEQFIVPENALKAKELFQEVLKGNAVTYDNAITTGNGKRLDVSVVLIPVSIAGKISSVLGIAQNITERRLAEWKLRESRQMLQLVINNIPQRVFWKNTELFFLGCNEALCEDAGLTQPDQIVGKSDYDFSWKAQAEAYRRDDLETMQSGRAKINFEEPQHREDGSEYWLRTSKIPLTNGEGQTIGILGLYEDITERKQLERKLEQMAHYDSLTGLPNRAFFHDQLHQAISRSKRHGSFLGLMYFDIDMFKHINDTYGHDIGDAVIALFAKRVKGTVREIDIVGRLGGDEFCLIVEDLSAKQDAEAVATKLIEAMRPAFRIAEMALQISTSIGVAFHEPGMAADELIRKADHAMYKAKQSGRNRFEIECDFSAGS